MDMKNSRLITTGLLFLLAGCATVNPQTVSEMSNGMLCELLGPKWTTTASERDTIYKEIERRGVTCAYGRVVSSPTQAPTRPAPAAPRPQPAPADPSSSVADAYALINGASIYADDDKYLGKLTSKFSSDSIYNEFGTHGSDFSSDSIWNQFGTYGSEFSSSSPWNEFSSSGPTIIKNGQVIGRLTINEFVQGGVSPTTVGAMCFDVERGNPN